MLNDETVSLHLLPIAHAYVVEWGKRVVRGAEGEWFIWESGRLLLGLATAASRLAPGSMTAGKKERPKRSEYRSEPRVCGYGTSIFHVPEI